MKSWNWISATGRSPFIAIPIAVPTMPSSESGVSKQRFGPKSRCRFSVARNTPPFLPTSSPKTSTLGSAFIAVRRPSLIAWRRVSVAMFVLGAVQSSSEQFRAVQSSSERELAVAGVGVATAAAEVEELLALLAQVRGDRRVDVREDGLEPGRADMLGGAHGRSNLLLDLLAQCGALLRVEQAGGLEELLEARDRVALLPELDLLRGDVALRVVGGRVATHAERPRLDQRRAIAGARALDRRERHLAHRQEVVAVHDDAGHAIGLGLDREPVRGGLLLHRTRDRPAVVLAQEHDRRLPHPGEVEAGVEAQARGPAVPEAGEHHGVLLAQPGRVRRADRLRNVRADRRGDRDEVDRLHE